MYSAGVNVFINIYKYSNIDHKNGPVMDPYGMTRFSKLPSK